MVWDLVEKVFGLLFIGRGWIRSRGLLDTVEMVERVVVFPGAVGCG